MILKQKIRYKNKKQIKTQEKGLMNQIEQEICFQNIYRKINRINNN